MLIHTYMLILNKKFNCIELSDRCIIITEYGICYGWYFLCLDIVIIKNKISTRNNKIVNP